MVGSAGHGVEGGRAGRPRSSASVDSATPHVRSVRLRMVAVAARLGRIRSGMTARPTISRISWGTPGTA